MRLFTIQSSHLQPILNSHGWINLFPADRDGDGFQYSLKIGAGTATTINIKVVKKGLECRADQSISQKNKALLRDTVCHMLSLDFPLEEFIAVCRKRKQQRLLALAKQGWGRMFRSPTFWEDSVKTLCTTNASWEYTQKMCLNLCLQLGEKTASGSKTFPFPEKVLKVGQRKLKENVGMGYRSKSLVMLAEKAVSGDVPWLMDFTQMPDAMTAEKEIRSWHGFGPYATKHLLVLMGFHDYLPIDREVGTHLGIRKPGDRGSELDSAHFEDWGKFRFTAYKLTRVAKRMNWIGN